MSRFEQDPSTSMCTSTGKHLGLQSVAATGTLHGLAFHLDVAQHWHNPLSQSVEAVYTFPLPVRAVLLRLELEVGGQKLAATAMARRAATQRYEAAIDNGDTAILLEHDGAGLYTVNVGHLRAGETAVIRYTYVELLDAFRGFVRLAVPTVIGPRYGDPAAANLRGPAVPKRDALVEYPLEISVVLADLHDPSALRSPSHALAVTDTPAGLQVQLDQRGYLDRDLVLQLTAANLPQRALVARDGDAWVALASLAVPVVEATRPLAVKVLLDCSGSMQGHSIAQAKAALHNLLANMENGERFSLTRFGSTVQHMTPPAETMDEAVRAPVLELVRRIDADLGGTNMANALQNCIAHGKKRHCADILLITDGEVYDIGASVQAVARSGHRLFVIAIGVAPNEGLARAVTDVAGGAVEFVADAHDAEAVILRMVERLRQSPQRVGRVSWGKTRATWQREMEEMTFGGATLHVAARLATQPTGVLTAEVDGRALTVPLPAEPDDLPWLPRWSAAWRVKKLPVPEATALAVQHNLVSQYTSMVVVAERDDGQNPAELPMTFAQPQMDVRAASMDMACYQMSLTAMAAPPSQAGMPAAGAVKVFHHARMSLRDESSSPGPMSVLADAIRRTVRAIVAAVGSTKNTAATESVELSSTPELLFDPADVPHLLALDPFATADGARGALHVVAHYLHVSGELSELPDDAKLEILLDLCVELGFTTLDFLSGLQWRLWRLLDDASAYPQLEARLRPLVGDRKHRELRRFMTQRVRFR